jgi:hypothetical protein
VAVTSGSLTSWKQLRFWAGVPGGQRDTLEELAGDTFVCQREHGETGSAGGGKELQNREAKTLGVTPPTRS